MENVVAILAGLISLALMLAMVAGMWKAFTKAGQPGWAIFVPIYNLVCILKIAGQPIWMIIGFFIPLINFLTLCWIFHNVAKRFGGGIGMSLLMIFLSPIGWMVLGFGGAQYNANVA